ncbi:MAG: aldo/keto reductase [Thermoguttaceae bacterium]|nr:aldo/keto reductase [Thermoguttaceae bacterium]
MDYFPMNNGTRIPMVGVGVYTFTPAEAQAAVETALRDGVRLIDTANAYLNEKGVGRAIKASGVPREEIFLVTKLWPSVYESETATDDALRRLGVDYVDLLFLHQPTDNWREGYRNVEKAAREGKVRAIGVSNFDIFPGMTEELVDFAEIKPQAVQVEAHPYYPQTELKKTLSKYGIATMAWYPLGHGDKKLLEEPVFAVLAEKYGKTSAQIALRWHVQSGNVVIPGSRNPDHIRQNFDLFDFALTEGEMAKIAALDKNERYYNGTPEQIASFKAWAPDFDAQE